MGSLGNHDAAPGDVFLGPKEQAWQYAPTGDSVWCCVVYGASGGSGTSGGRGKG